MLWAAGQRSREGGRSVAEWEVHFDDGSEQRERGGLVHEQQQHGRHEVHGLAVPHGRIVPGVCDMSAVRALTAIRKST